MLPSVTWNSLTNLWQAARFLCEQFSSVQWLRGTKPSLGGFLCAGYVQTGCFGELASSFKRFSHHSL